MKKVFLIVLCLTLLTGLIGCNGPSEPDGSGAEDVSAIVSNSASSGEEVVAPEGGCLARNRSYKPGGEISVVAGS